MEFTVKLFSKHSEHKIFGLVHKKKMSKKILTGIPNILSVKFQKDHSKDDNFSHEIFEYVAPN